MLNNNFFKIMTLCLSFWSIGVSETGQKVFDGQKLHKIQIDFLNLDSTWKDTLFDSHRRWMFEQDSALKIHEYYRAKLTFDGEVIDTIGVRFKGEYSFTFDRKPLKLDINEFVSGQKLDGLKKINLQAAADDTTQIREKLVYDLFAWSGAVAPRTSFAKVYVNGIYYSVMTIVEQVDKTFRKYHYSNPNGNLYKAYYVDLNDEYNQPWKGNGRGNGLEIKSNETNHDWSFMEKIYDLGATVSGSDYSDSLQKYVDFKSLLKHMAIEIATVSYDNFANGGGANIYWLVDSTDNKLKAIPWDFNLSLNTVGDNSFITQINSIVPDSNARYGGNGYYYNSLQRRKFSREGIFTSSTLKKEYFDHLCWINEKYFAVTNIDSLIDFWSMQIKSDVYGIPGKKFTNAEYDQSVQNLKDFFSIRKSSLTTRLANQSHTCSTFVSVSSISALDISIKPNQTVLVNSSVLPANATYSNLRYSILDESIAKVSAFGEVSALAIGKTKLNIHNPESGITKQIEIDVNSQVTTLIKDKDNQNFYAVDRMLRGFESNANIKLVNIRGEKIILQTDFSGSVVVPSSLSGTFYIMDFKKGFGKQFVFP